MDSRFDAIFRPLRIKTVTLRNRIVVPPMLQLRPITSRQGIAWYRRLAAGGAAMVIIEGTAISRFESELTADNLAPLAAAIHEQGATAVMQLSPPKFDRPQVPDTLTGQRVERLAEQYALATRICRGAGFDGVEPHGAHGFLLNQFFMPDRNHRADRYGGSLENRCRLAVQIVQQIRLCTDDAMVVLYRHTPRGEAYGIEESVVLAKRLVEAGVDVLDISPAQDKAVADLAEPFRGLGVPVIAVGGLEDPAASAQAIDAGRCDLVALGRQLIRDAEWPNKVHEDRLAEVGRCEKCNQGCYGNIRKGLPVVCVHWSGQELAAFL